MIRIWSNHTNSPSNGQIVYNMLALRNTPQINPQDDPPRE